MTESKSSSEPTTDSKQETSPLYPPAKHMMRDLRFCCYGSGDKSTVGAPVVPEILNHQQSVSAGFLATLIDVYAARRAVHECEPDMIATSDLSFHITRPLHGPFITTSGKILRQGKRNIVIEVHLFESDSIDQIGSEEQCIGKATVSFARLPRREENTLSYPKYDAAGKVDFALLNSGLDQHFLDYLGTKTIDSSQGIIEVDINDGLTNRLHALQGGAVAWLIDHAAEVAVSQKINRAAFCTGLAINFLSLAKLSPIRTQAELIGDNGQQSRIRVNNANGDLAAIAIATLSTTTH